MRLRIRPASLRTRTLLAMLAMLVVLVGVLLFLADSIIGRSFQALEQRTVEERVQQAANALADTIASLERTTNDYARWDDTYAFVSTPEPTYIADNMADATFIDNNLSYIAFVNTAGELVYGRAFDLANEQEVPLPAELGSFDGIASQLLQHSDPQNRLSGLVVLADGPLLIAARPILTSLGEGPPAGTLLMGRRLDAHELARLAEITRLPLTITRLDNPALPPAARSAAIALGAGQNIVITPLDTSRISGAIHGPDLFGGPGLLLQLELPREVFQLGRQATREYTLVLLGTGLLFGVIVAWILERTVLARTIALSNQVGGVDASRLDTQITITGGDEIGQLGSTINRMLYGLAQAQQQIAASEQRYRQLIELTPDAIIIHDGRHIRYTNPAGAYLLESESAAAVAGRPLDAAIATLRPQESGEPLIVERMLTRSDGSIIEAELVVLPFFDRDTPATQVIVRNITERKQVEKALREAKAAADAANLAKSHFLSTMSHELRTPLTAILGYTELLDYEIADHASETALRDLGRIRAAGAHLLTIINDVLDFSKIEAGRMQVHVAPITLAPLLTMVADTIQPLAAQNNNRFEIHGVEAAGTMMTDAGHLRQILINLIGNACKFTHEGKITLTVTCVPGEQVAFAVQDTGIGMSPDQLDMLFRDFVQVDSSPTRKYGGTGLGLALSRRLARLLGGDITVTSQMGVGSIFTLTLPRTSELEPDLGLAEPDNAVLNPSSAALYDTPLPRTWLVLVIDDDPAVRDLLPRALAHPSLHIETAASGPEGLEMAGALLPDLIILDVLLPELDGWMVLRELKDNPETSSIPVLMLSISEDIEQGLVLGATGIQHKPVDTEQLLKQMQALLGERAGPLHVLLVEDDPELRDYLRRTLIRGGWIVDEAGDAQTALALLEQHPPALAIVDLMLPGMDGISLIATMRNRPEGDALPILVVTAKELSQEEQEQLNRSMAQVLHKGSFRGDTLLHSTWALLRSHGLPTPQQEGRNDPYSRG